MNARGIVRDGLWDNNVVFAQMLALCPAMAVTTSGTNGLGMGLATTAVLVVSNALVAAIRHLVSPQVRIPIFVVLMGVAADGRLLGVRIVKHAETPGLGDKIEIAKAKWVLDFDGKSLGDPPTEKWAVKKDGGVFDQFAGATITPRAVVKAVKRGLDFFATHCEAILS